uniref:Alternative protein JRK n=1 Tax=Homo sapiens TaxID=9606 RepID=L0R881_HUMAN|nr:alternative protein JRK [Homo sapiens]
MAPAGSWSLRQHDGLPAQGPAPRGRLWEAHWPWLGPIAESLSARPFPHPGWLGSKLRGAQRPSMSAGSPVPHRRGSLGLLSSQRN